MSSYYTGKTEVDERLKRLYYLQGLTEQMLNNSYLGDEKFPEEMEVLRAELSALHGRVILKEDLLLRWKMLGPTTDEEIDTLTMKAERFHEYLVVLGLMFS